MAPGGRVAGAPGTFGVRYALLICIGLGLPTTAFQWFMGETDEASQATTGDALGIGFFGVVRSFSPGLRELLISDILIHDWIVTSGSFLGAWLGNISPRANFIGAAVCGAAGTLWFWWFIYRKRAFSGIDAMAPAARMFEKSG